MKYTILTLLTALSLGSSALAADSVGKPQGPNSGRVVTSVEPKLEIVVTKDRMVEITALTADLKPAPFSGQVIAVTAGDRSHPTKLDLKEEGGKLVSTNPLPEGNDIPVSVSIKPNAGGKAVYEKFNLNLAKCPTCANAEYACVCAH